MPKVIAHHDVDDKAHWLAQPTRNEFFGGMGISVTEFIDPEHPNRVAVLLDVPDMDALQAAMQSEEAAAAMANDGVRAETMVLLVEA